MAFTETEIRYIFECLDVPYSSGYYTVDPMGTLGSLTDISNASQGQAKTQILTYLAAMDATSITMAQALVVEWQAVRKSTVSVNNGAIGDNAVTGVTYNAEDQQKSVRDRMNIYVPFYKYHEVLARRAGSSNSMSIATLW